MDWIAQHWQTLTAVGIVAVTILIFLRRAFRRSKGRSCGKNCGCDGSKP